jgi:hypothetical protein
VGTHGLVHVRHGNGGGHNVPCPEAQSDQHGNVLAREGCDRCPCGAKYWENDVCVSCGSKFDPGYCSGCGQTFNGARGLRAHQNSKFLSLACREL